MAYEVTCFKSFTLKVAITQTTQTPFSRSEPLLECLLWPHSSRVSPSILIISKLELSKELQYSMLGKYQPRSFEKLVLLPKKEVESLKWCYKKKINEKKEFLYQQDLCQSEPLQDPWKFLPKGLITSTLGSQAGKETLDKMVSTISSILKYYKLLENSWAPH